MPNNIKTFVGNSSTPVHDENLTHNRGGMLVWREQIFRNGNVSRKATERFDYSRGKLTAYWGTQAQLASYSSANSNNLHYMSIDYDFRYGLPKTTTYRQDANTEVKVVNTLSADGKSIARTSTTVNNVETERTDFTYDTYGNIATKKDYINNFNNFTNFIQTDYTYYGHTNASGALVVPWKPPTKTSAKSEQPTTAWATRRR